MLRMLKSVYNKAFTPANCRVQESDGSFFESYTALAWRQENKRLRAASEVRLIIIIITIIIVVVVVVPYKGIMRRRIENVFVLFCSIKKRFFVFVVICFWLTFSLKKIKTSMFCFVLLKSVSLTIYVFYSSLVGLIS